MEDGVLWRATATTTWRRGSGARAPAPRAPASSAATCCWPIDGRPVTSVAGRRRRCSTPARAGRRCTTWSCGCRHAAAWSTSRSSRSRRARAGSTSRWPSVGIFSLLVGASVRLRRPDHQATLHFFWLTVAFFGVLAFSFTGRLDALDWIFYWGDLTAQLLLPPLFLHFALVFPGSARRVGAQRRRARAAAALYLPALLARRRVGRGRDQRGARTATCCRASRSSSRSRQLLYLAVSLVAGLAIMMRALRRVRSVTARRQLRWIVWGTALGVAAVRRSATSLPFALGLQPPRGFEFTALLLGLDPAGLRVGDRPLPPDGRRSHHQARPGLRGGAGGDRRDLRRSCSDSPARSSCSDADQRNPVIALLATLVVVLLSRPVKNAIQTGARPRLLPRSLRLPPRARRLRARPQQRSRPAAAQRAARPPRHRDAASSIAWRCMLAPVSVASDDGDFVDDRARRLPRCAAALDSRRPTSARA